MIHAAAPHFLWSFAVRYAAHQLNLWPRVSEPQTSPTLRWTGKVGDASVFRVLGALSLVRDAKASKLSSRTLRCIFLGFPTDAPPWQFYHLRERRVFSSQDVTFDESASGRGDLAADDTAAIRRSPRLDTPPGFLPRPSSLPPQPAALDSGAEIAGVELGGAETEGPGVGQPLQPDLLEMLSPQAIRAWIVRRGSLGGGGYGPAGTGATSPGGAAGAGGAGGTAGGVASVGGTRGAADAGGTRATSLGGAGGAARAGGAGATSPGGATVAGAASPRGPAGAGGAGAAGTEGAGAAGVGGAGGASGAGGAGDGGNGGTGDASPRGARTAGTGAAGAGGAASAGGAGGTAGGSGGARAAGPGGARTRGDGAAGSGGATGAGGAGGAAGATGTGVAGGTAGARGAGAAEARNATGAGGVTRAAGVGGARAAGAHAAGAGGAGAARTAPRRPLSSSTGLTPPLLSPPADLSQPQRLPAPPPYTEVTESLAKRREPETHASTPVRACRFARRRTPAVPGTHSMALRPSSVPLCVVLPEPPASSLPHVPDPESDLARAATPTITSRSRLDYVASLVTESESICSPSVGGEPALSSDVLEDRQFELECLAAALPHFASMLLCPEGDPDALDIPTPRSYAEAITGEYSSRWQTPMDGEMASWKSTGT
ncbi:unnamed protein product [Closterium sp. NIES-53]